MDGRASILPEWWELICFNIINTLVVDGGLPFLDIKST